MAGSNDSLDLGEACMPNNLAHGEPRLSEIYALYPQLRTRLSSAALNHAHGSSGGCDLPLASQCASHASGVVASALPAKLQATTPPPAAPPSPAAPETPPAEALPALDSFSSVEVSKLASIQQRFRARHAAAAKTEPPPPASVAEQPTTTPAPASPAAEPVSPPSPSSPQNRRLVRFGETQTASTVDASAALAGNKLEAITDILGRLDVSDLQAADVKAMLKLTTARLLLFLLSPNEELTAQVKLLVDSMTQHLPQRASTPSVTPPLTRAAASHYSSSSSDGSCFGDALEADVAALLATAPLEVPPFPLLSGTCVASLQRSASHDRSGAARSLRSFGCADISDTSLRTSSAAGSDAVLDVAPPAPSIPLVSETMAPAPAAVTPVAAPLATSTAAPSPAKSSPAAEPSVSPNSLVQRSESSSTSTLAPVYEGSNGGGLCQGLLDDEGAFILCDSDDEA